MALNHVDADAPRVVVHAGPTVIVFAIVDVRVAPAPKPYEKCSSPRIYCPFGSICPFGSTCFFVGSSLRKPIPLSKSSSFLGVD